MPGDSIAECASVCYKHVNGTTPVYFNAYSPPGNDTPRVSGYKYPAVIYFHGGGLTVGNKDSWFPTWLQRRVLDLGYIFVSADYRLIPPSTGHNIVEDIQDLVSFLSTNTFDCSGTPIRVDPARLAVSGSSAGGLCAYLAAMHCNPKPTAVLSLYGMGGNFLTPHYFQPKSEVFFRGRELLDPSHFSEYLHSFNDGILHPVVDSPLAYHPQTHHIPGYPANPRMLLARLYLQLGNYLDYYTGAHNPSLSEALRFAHESTLSKPLVPKAHRSLFPQFDVNQTWPPTMLLHGTHDTAVLIEESRHLKTLLANAGVETVLLEFEGEEHSFDYEAGAADKWKVEFDFVKDFLRKALER